MTTPPTQTPRGNGKTALALLSIVCVCFIGVIANRVLFG